EGALASFVVDSDARVKAQIQELLAKLRELGRLAARLDLADATAVIFAVFNQHFAAYLTRNDLQYPAMFAMMQRHVRLLFAAWTPQRKSVSGSRSMKRLKSLIGACMALPFLTAGMDTAFAQQAQENEGLQE